MSESDVEPLLRLTRNELGGLKGNFWPISSGAHWPRRRATSEQHLFESSRSSDRATGKPLIGIDERAVPQEPRQATAATQPYPQGDAIVPQSIDIPPEGSSVLPNGAALVNDGKIFTPFWTDPIAMKPGTMGGANWPPSSYDPETHLLYVCASDRINSFSVQNELPQPSANRVYMGGRFTTGIQ